MSSSSRTSIGPLPSRSSPNSDQKKVERGGPTLYFIKKMNNVSVPAVSLLLEPTVSHISRMNAFKSEYFISII